MKSAGWILRHNLAFALGALPPETVMTEIERVEALEDPAPGQKPVLDYDEEPNQWALDRTRRNRRLGR